MVTIIVPAYNVAPYLRECIDSIRSQSYPDWELIIVDDGSTDATPAIADSYAAKDHRIRAIHRTNGGLSAARNSGLDAARGDWVLFVDGDDLIHPAALETLMDAAQGANAQMVSARLRRFRDLGSLMTKGAGEPPRREFTPREAILNTLYQEDITNSLCGKLFDADLWRDVRFRDGILYEDLDIFTEIWSRAEKIVHLDADLYLYRQHPGSLIHTFTRRRADVLDVTARIHQRMLRTGDPALIDAAIDREFAANFNILLLTRRHRRSTPPPTSDAPQPSSDAPQPSASGAPQPSSDAPQPSSDAPHTSSSGAPTSGSAAECGDSAAALRGEKLDEYEDIRERCKERIRQLRDSVMRNRRSRLKNRLAALLSRLLF